MQNKTYVYTQCIFSKLHNQHIQLDVSLSYSNK